MTYREYVDPDDYIYISRDSFARHDRVKVPVETSGDCCFCGSKRSDGKLFRFGIDPDSGRQQWDGKLFCEMSCRDSYYE